MASLNKVFLMGNLTREPELRYTPNGSPVCDLGLAVSRKYTQNGQEREDVCFVDITVWEKQAEACGKFLQKGSPVFVEGRLQYDQWTDKDQNKRSRLRVQAERVQFIGPRRDNNGGYGQDGQQGGYAPRRQVPQDGGYQRQDNAGFYNRRSTAGGYAQQTPRQGGIPPQMPSPDYEDAQPSYDDDPTRSAAPRRQSESVPVQSSGAVPPPPPPPLENGSPAGIEDDIPF